MSKETVVKVKVKEETKKEKFHRLAGARINKIVKQIDLLGNCSNKSQYEFVVDDIKKMSEILLKSINTCMLRFSNDKQETKDEFKF